MATLEDIKKADISPAYKRALTKAYKASRDEDRGYWLKNDQVVYSYILGLSDAVPEDHGVELDEIFDSETVWDDLDGRILDLCLLDKSHAYFLILSRLDGKAWDNPEAEHFSALFAALKERNAIDDEWALCCEVMNAHPDVLSDHAGGPTSFGRALLDLDFERTWSFALDMGRNDNSDAPKLLADLYTLLQQAQAQEFSKYQGKMIEDMISLGKPSIHRLIGALARHLPDGMDISPYLEQIWQSYVEEKDKDYQNAAADCLALCPDSVAPFAEEKLQSKDKLDKALARKIIRRIDKAKN